MGFPDSSVGKESTCNAGDSSLISGLGKIRWKRDRLPTTVFPGFHCGSAGKESACKVGDPGLIPGLGRSPGERNGYPLQYSDLENSMDCIVHGVARSQTWVSNFHFHISIIIFPFGHCCCGSAAKSWFSCEVISDFATSWTTVCQIFPVLQHFPEFAQIMSTESVMPSNHLILCHPLLLLTSIFPSIRVFSNKSAICIRWPKNWSFSFSISPSYEYSGLIIYLHY